jgi:hypothetical protein
MASSRASRPKIPIVAASIAAAGVAGLAALFALLRALGTSACDIYCGPPATWIGALILIPVTLLLWLSGLILAIVVLGATRARSRLGWGALALSLVVPVAVVVGASAVGWGNFASY